MFDAVADRTDEKSAGVEFARTMFAADRASGRLGMRLLTNAPGSATVALTVTEDTVNGHELTHGGIVFVLASLRSRWLATGTVARPSPQPDR